MKHLSSILLATALLALGATACFKDPTNPLANGPSRITLSLSSAFIPAGDSVSVTAEIKDDAGNTFSAGDAGWESSVPGVASVRRDEVVVPGNAFTRAFILAITPGQTIVRITASGITDSVQVVVLPRNFAGAVTAPAGSMMGDTITIAATSVLGFTASTAVTIGGKVAWIISQTATQLKVMASEPAAGGSAVVLGPLKLLGTVDVASLTATTSLGVAATIRANGYSPANEAPATAPAGLLASRYTTPIIGVLNGTVADNYWAFTTPAASGTETTGDSVEVTVVWKTDADIDVAVLNASGACISSALPGSCYGTMGTGNNPEVGKWRLAAATTYLIDANLYDAGAAAATAYRVSFRRLAVPR